MYKDALALKETITLALALALLIYNTEVIIKTLTQT